MAAVIGKITTGNKKEKGGATDIGGLFIKNLQKKNVKSYKVVSEHDGELQLELIYYNNNNKDEYLDFVNRRKEEVHRSIMKNKFDFNEKYEASLKKITGDDDFDEKKVKLDNWLKGQVEKHPIKSEELYKSLDLEILEKYKNDCMRAPIQMVDFDDVIVGRLSWDQNKNTTFCRNLIPIGGYINNGGFSGKAIRSSFSKDGSKSDEIVDCNTRECPYATDKGLDGFACKPVAKMNVHLNLPSSPSNGSDFSIDTRGYNSRQNIIDFFEKANKFCGGFLSGMDMEIVVRRKTMIDSAGNTRNPKLIYLRFKSSMDEVLGKATKNIDRILKLQQVKNMFKDSVSLFKLSEEDMAGDDDLSAEKEEEVVKPVEKKEDKPEKVVTKTDDGFEGMNDEEIPF